MAFVRRRLTREVRDGRDIVLLTSSQDVEPILKANRELMNANGSGRSSLAQGRNWIKIASVPLILIDQWKQQGLDFSDPNDWPILKRLLNDSDFSKLRTAPGRF